MTKIVLKHPIEFGSETVSELEFRRGRLGDLKGITLGETLPADTLITIAARLCGKATPLLEKLDADDAGEVVAIALGFVEQCLANGRKD